MSVPSIGVCVCVCELLLAGGEGEGGEGACSVQLSHGHTAPPDGSGHAASGTESGLHVPEVTSLGSQAGRGSR